MLDRIKKVIVKEKTLSINIVGAFMVKGASMLLSLFTMPAYMRYFQDNMILGIWYTMLSVLTWITMFDLGIGNGLRNKLVESLAKNERREAKEYISSAYIIITLVAVCLALGFTIARPHINWNSFLNVSEDSINKDILSYGMSVIIYGIFLRFILALVNSMLYAIQKSAVNNFLALVSNLAIFLFVSFAPSGDVESNLISLSYWQVIFSNLPLLVATVIIFFRSLKGLAPDIRCFRSDKARSVLNIGLVLLWLQVVAMIILSTHSFLITRFVGAEQVVEYNIYYKVFNTIASLIVLALTPVWSAVTKAQAEKNYTWIQKIYLVTLALPVVTLIISVAVIPFLQWFFNFWLRENTVTVDIWKAVIMIVFNVLFVLHYVNININNGLSEFKTQTFWMTIGAILMIPICKFMCSITGDWTGVLIGCSLSILPYQLIQPFTGMKYLNKMGMGEKVEECK